MSHQYRISNNLLGEGSYSKVYLGFDKKTNKKVAIKIVDLMNAPKGTMQLLQREIQLMTKIRDQEGFVRLIDSFEDNKGRLYIVLELLHGTLFDLLKFRRILSDLEAKSIFRQIVESVRALHDQNIVHRDVKLENISIHQHRYRESLLLTEYKVKLGDFGFAKEISYADEKLTEYCGTPSYAAPELVASTPYDGKKSDVWSLGVLLYSLVCGKFPFVSTRTGKPYEAILVDLFSKITNQAVKFPSKLDLSSDLQDLLLKMLDKNPNTRLSIDEVLEHSWLNEETISDVISDVALSPQATYRSEIILGEEKADSLECTSDDSERTESTTTSPSSTHSYQSFREQVKRDGICTSVSGVGRC
jgi:5'-AMP-activated protein kinase catalytic alpha subunit